MGPVVYVDVLFVLNFVLNLLLLWTTGKLAKNSTRLMRLSLGAALGALYAVLMFFPELGIYYTVLAKLLFSMCMVAVSYKIERWKEFLVLLALFYMVSFTFGGAALGLFYFTDIGATLGAVISNGVFYMNFPWEILVISTAVAYGVISIGWRLYRRAVNGKNLILKLSLTVDGETVTVDALLDTGNTLFDPISGLPVVIAEQAAISPILPSFLGREESTLWGDLPGNWKRRLRMIPFSSIGRENGMMVGFKPDAAEVEGQPIGEVIVALSPKPLSKEHRYFALLHPEMAVLSG